MNYFFLPQIHSLRSTLTLANFPPTEKNLWEPKTAYIHAAFSNGHEWAVQFVKQIKPGESTSVEIKDLMRVPDSNRSVFFFMYPKRLPEKLDQLPTDDYMESEPSWRGNIQLSSETTSVSFQGEYPGFMLKPSKGKLLTFNPLIQNQIGIVTQLIVIVLLQIAEIKTGRLIVARQISGKIEKEFQIATNTCNVLELNELQEDYDDPLCLYSPDMIGIPLFFSHDSSYRFLSLEHSYPLNEVTVFGDNARRHGFLKKIKSHWIEFLEKNVST
ncbi:MAG: hypothetical protein CMH70_03950 [Nitrosomonadaceae bacterium]|nr:hypothetical protein [Nitrosomonadaceae bacterium]|tara:strand:+ start:1382 stop:2194 length:813 start_codon:yes stop_codon:yes gene_type:complete